MSEDSERCPYIENQMQTEEGAQAWDLTLKSSGQLRLCGMGGVAGIDLGAALKIADALGYDLRVMAYLLPSAERGLVSALNKREDQS